MGGVRFFEDFSVGEVFRSRGRTITEADIASFAGVTGDYFQLHINEEFAARGPFKSRVVHGSFTLAASIGMMVQEGLWAENLLAWLGARELRLTAPLRAGDTIYVEETVSEKRDVGKPDWGIITLRHVVKNQRGEQVLEAELLYAVYKRGMSPYL